MNEELKKEMADLQESVDELGRRMAASIFIAHSALYEVGKSDDTDDDTYEEDEDIDLDGRVRGSGSHE